MKTPSTWRTACCLLSAFLFAPLLCAAATSSQPANCPAPCVPVVVKLTLHDTVQPVSAAYLQRGLRYAADEHATAVLISLGTPGGLLSSMREMVSAIELSPVILYVEPTGARAGSAGFFLLEAADVAAMAPGTNAGAAHPIIEGRTLDPILKKKVEEDATALLRSITMPRHRDSAAATSAVLDARAYTAAEALQLHLIDIVSPSESALLTSVDGRSITRFDGSTVILHLAGAHIQELPPSLRERLLTRLTDPDLAVLLLILGLLLIYLEFNIPGTIVPGALGLMCFLLALFGLNMLPIGHFAVILLLAALLLIVLEVKFASHGVLAAAGTVALIFGLLTLVNGPPEMRVHPAVAISAGLTFGGITFLLAWLGLRARRNKARLGAAAMIGLTGVLSRPAEPAASGAPHSHPQAPQPQLQIEVRGEIWRVAPFSGSGDLISGDMAEVVAVNGLTLLVRTTPTKV